MINNSETKLDKPKNKVSLRDPESLKQDKRIEERQQETHQEVVTTVEQKGNRLQRISFYIFQKLSPRAKSQLYNASYKTIHQFLGDYLQKKKIRVNKQEFSMIRDAMMRLINREQKKDHTSMKEYDEQLTQEEKEGVQAVQQTPQEQKIQKNAELILSQINSSGNFRAGERKSIRQFLYQILHRDYLRSAAQPTPPKDEKGKKLFEIAQQIQYRTLMGDPKKGPALAKALYKLLQKEFSQSQKETSEAYPGAKEKSREIAQEIAKQTGFREATQEPSPIEFEDGWIDSADEEIKGNIERAKQEGQKPEQLVTEADRRERTSDYALNEIERIDRNIASTNNKKRIEVLRDNQNIYLKMLSEKGREKLSKRREERRREEEERKRNIPPEEVDMDTMGGLPGKTMEDIRKVAAHQLQRLNKEQQQEILQALQSLSSKKQRHQQINEWIIRLSKQYQVPLKQLQAAFYREILKQKSSQKRTPKPTAPSKKAEKNPEIEGYLGGRVAQENNDDEIILTEEAPARSKEDDMIVLTGFDDEKSEKAKKETPKGVEGYLGGQVGQEQRNEETRKRGNEEDDMIILTEDAPQKTKPEHFLPGETLKNVKLEDLTPEQRKSLMEQLEGFIDDMEDAEADRWIEKKVDEVTSRYNPEEADDEWIALVDDEETKKEEIAGDLPGNTQENVEDLEYRVERLENGMKELQANYNNMGLEVEEREDLVFNAGAPIAYLLHPENIKDLRISPALIKKVQKNAKEFFKITDQMTDIGEDLKEALVKLKKKLGLSDKEKQAKTA